MLNFCKKHLAASCAVVLFSAALAPVDCMADEAAVKARIERARIELAKIKQGQKLSILDATRPEVVLPPLLILVDEDLKEFGIDKEALAADIKANPAKYRNTAPEHWRKRFLLLAPEQESSSGMSLTENFRRKGTSAKIKSKCGGSTRLSTALSRRFPGRIAKTSNFIFTATTPSTPSASRTAPSMSTPDF